MPELPEVETIRRHIDTALRGKRLKSVKADLTDTIVFDRASPRAVERALRGAKVVGSGRRGKYFWLELDRRPWLVMHLGMSGNAVLHLPKQNASRLKLKRSWASISTDPSVAPRFARLTLTAEDGTQVVIVDPRRFGRIRLAKDPVKEAPISKLGYDPLEGLPAAARLRAILGSRRAPIKAVLLDQALFAGVGNWIADEVLFQARIAPQRLASSLDATEVKRLRTRVLSVIKKAVLVEADYTRFPKSWLFHDRWEKGKESYHSHGHAIEHATIGGRTTAWVPALQK